MDRRNFTKVATLAGGGFMLSFHSIAKDQFIKNEVANSTNELGDLLKITPDGQVLFQFIKHEMGQGVSTAMAMIVAEELGADWQQVKIEFPDTDLKKFQNDKNGGHDTGGSCTITYQYDVLRNAGATARQMLILAAAKRWNTSVENCYAENHFINNHVTAQKLGFGELASDAATHQAPPTIVLKDQKDFKLIGKPRKAKLITSIVTGKLKYGLDVNLPGMHYAVIARCPVFKGKLKSFDASKTLQVKGVKKVFDTKPIAGLQTQTPYMPHDIREGVVVVADSFWAAKKGRDALIINWDDGPNAQRSSEDFEKLAARRALHRTDPTGYIGDENAVSDLGHVRRTLRASYVYPHQLHSCLEPLNCTAYAMNDRCEIWMGSQAPNLIVTELMRVFNISQDTIKVHSFPSGGGFGRRYYPDMAVEAVFISRQAGNIPVKMIWTREDDHQCNLAHLFQHMEYQVALDNNDRLYAWYEKEIRTYMWGAKYADTQLPFMAYDIPNIRFDFEDLIEEELVHSSAWRGVVGHGRFYSECFIDEIATALKKDPYQFRLDLLKEGRDVFVGDLYPISSSRLLSVLKLAAGKAGWGKSLEPNKGMGLAVCPYGNSYCAIVAEVKVQNKKISIVKITVGVDCGKVINPSGANNQIAGGIVWGLTALLYGGLPIKNGRAVHTNFHQNKLMRMDECPEIAVHFAETDDERPWGIGEISSPLAVPAVLNAIYAATGKRIRKIPIIPDELQ
ncbi:xanthine dehydrogenase family protein molybdopterin-binding subunit [Spirosoma knui]